MTTQRIQQPLGDEPGDPPKAVRVNNPALRPQDAATLIIVDSAGGMPRILFGKRRMDQKFMPGKYVFPGGRVDKDDARVKLGGALAPTEAQKLLKQMKGRPSAARANALALSAVRETFEETGLLIGRKLDEPVTTSAALWQNFLGHGVTPHLASMTFLARAITPPGKPRRYDTRFFCVRADDIVVKLDSSDGELTELHWLTLDEARGFDLPNIQKAILEDLADRLTAGAIGPSHQPVPFYHMLNGSFRRDLLTADADA